MQSIQLAKEAQKHFSLLSAEAKNEILRKIGEALLKKKKFILQENAKDIKIARGNLLDRLLLNNERIEAIVRDLEKVIELPDPIGHVLEDRTLENGLQLQRVRVPIGVIAIIYEARPNVTVDAATLCLKSGNAVILKGGSDAIHSNRAIVKVMKDALAMFDSLHHVLQFVDSIKREATLELLQLRNIIDVVIPRGGKGLIDFVKEHSKIPVIETGASVVHIFVDEFADIKKAVAVVTNAKLRRTSICNALDTLLLHQSIAPKFLAAFVAHLKKEKMGLEFRADPKSHDILRAAPAPAKASLTLKKAGPQDFDTEFLAPILAVRVVKNLQAALDHIEKHSLGHSEAIITDKRENAERFLQEVDAACVYWNASTQFSDGAQFGLGAEIGISTQKLHVRGPFALEGLTSYKWVIKGNYQVRP